MSARFAGLTAELRAARERKGLSQRTLAEKVGLPQGHLSRIERGEVDVQISNLMELARALEFELVLVPRQALPAIEALTRQAAAPSIGATPAYTLDDDDEGPNER
jgi:HTH-type transcriptional regulator/antitoxin HipB